MAIYDYTCSTFTDFNDPKNVKQYKQALQTITGHFGKRCPLIINGKRVKTETQLASTNPANHSEVVGHIDQAGIPEADRAMDAALNAFTSWKTVSVNVRADVLFKAAAIMRRRRYELSALMTKEAGKPYAEADGDTAEAIDFLEYYGRQIIALQDTDKAILSRPDVERNEYRYIPLGVGVIITPWNFPLAILTGMTSAAVVSGNTVLIKPAGPTGVIAHTFVEILEEAGLPDGVVNFVPGKGSEIGNYLVKHPKTRFVSFTGSKEIGILISENAAKVQPSQIWLKRVIAEMGGKNAIIVDEGVDPKDAARYATSSAFGYSGQKCSACSRLIVHESVYDEVLEKLKEATDAIRVGDPADANTFMGPVIDEHAFQSIAEYIDIGKQEGRLLIGGTVDNNTGWFIEPTIFADVNPNARIMQEEIFGPVLAVTKVNNFNEALDVANGTEFGLTGAVLSTNREHLERARDEFHVGNLYFNRGCTGSIVGYQPFGGFNMSGTDAKAGGPDYLLLHLQAKTVTEAL